MCKILEKIVFWYKNSRPYSIPITFLSWLVIFVYSLKSGGDFINGIIAYVGIALVHLATNLSDDYFDFLHLSENTEQLNATKSIKCSYLKDGTSTVEDLRNVLIIMFFVAAICGIYLFFRSGIMVFVFMLAAFPIALLYSFLSRKGLGDIAVILAYGPLMFEGVYYVMTRQVSWMVLILSFACAMFVNTILYVHMLMDYDEDVYSYKTTLCTLLGSKETALRFLVAFYLFGYLLILLFAVMSGNYYYIFSFLTVPMVVELYKYLEIYIHDKSHVPEVKFYHYPLEGWGDKSKTPSAGFFFRFMYARNISTIFMLIVMLSIILYS